ncbi:MAG: DHHA1 domain-containing protein [Candidatus Aenigmatarchaeota archaeon]
MLKKFEHLLEKGRKFIENIKGGEKVVLVYDADADGLCSATLSLFVLKKMKKKVKCIETGFTKIEKLKTELKRFKKIITVDVPTDLIEKHLLSLRKNMLIIDHHPGKDLNSKKVVLINPRLENPKIYQPTSYVIYKMFSDLVKEKKWVAIVGTVGDFGIEDCKDLVKIKNKKNIWKNNFGRAAIFLNNSISVLGSEKTLEILVGLKNLKELLKNREIITASKKFNYEFLRCKKEYKKNLEIYGEILISKIKPKYKGICSAIITKLSTKNPEKIIFIFEEVEKGVKIHGRSGDKKIDIGELFRKLGIGGGHEAAGAGIIDRKKEKEVKTKILEELKNLLNIENVS